MGNGRYGTGPRVRPPDQPPESMSLESEPENEPDLRIVSEQPAAPATADTILAMAEHRLSVVRLELQRLGELQSEERRLVRLIEASRAEQ